MGTITLEGMEFFAYHGVYEEERRMGNRYRVDVTVQTDLSEAGRTDNLAQSVDYGKLYEITRQEMQTSSQLLEHVAHRILENICRVFPQLHWAEVSISKFNPPVGGVCHRSVVTLRRTKQLAVIG